MEYSSDATFYRDRSRDLYERTDNFKFLGL
jgi:hypothetical protein